MTAVPLEGEFKKNEVTVEESDHFEEVSSLPYKIDFNLPVVKVMCGDLFGGLLSADGQVFTWGSNMYGKLGIKNEQVCLVQNPVKVNFGDDFIKDIACGFDHCIAMTAKD